MYRPSGGLILLFIWRLDCSVQCAQFPLGLTPDFGKVN